MTRKEMLAYLLAEKRRLVEEHDALRAELEVLRKSNFPRAAYKRYCHCVIEHRAKLANHRIAIEWTFHPPCGRRKAA